MLRHRNEALSAAERDGEQEEDSEESNRDDRCWSMVVMVARVLRGRIEARRRWKMEQSERSGDGVRPLR